MKALLFVIASCLIKLSVQVDCDTRTDCDAAAPPSNRICVISGSFTGFCTCPPGLIGDECRTVDPDQKLGECVLPDVAAYADSCPFPYPTGTPCQVTGCAEADEICCLTADGCSTECVKRGCDEANVKVCNDQGKVCLVDATSGFICICPSGYTGDDCKTRAMVDEKCDDPKINEPCDAIVPSCTATVNCEGKKICCSTGCGTACVENGGSGGIFGGSSLLTFFLLQQFLPGTGGGLGGPRCPQCDGCRRKVCHNDIGAMCRTACPSPQTNNQCYDFFIDYYTKDWQQPRIVTGSCGCPANQPFTRQSCQSQIAYCNAYACAGEQLYCHVSACGQCTIWWADMYGNRRNCRTPTPKQRGLFGKK